MYLHFKVHTRMLFAVTAIFYFSVLYFYKRRFSSLFIIVHSFCFNMILLKSVLEVGLISFLDQQYFLSLAIRWVQILLLQKSRTSRYPLISWLMGKNCSLTSLKFMGEINELNQKRIMGQHWIKFWGPLRKPTSDKFQAFNWSKNSFGEIHISQNSKYTFRECKFLLHASLNRKILRGHPLYYQWTNHSR